jgi:hypothetical protein
MTLIGIKPGSVNRSILERYNSMKRNKLNQNLKKNWPVKEIIMQNS